MGTGPFSSVLTITTNGPCTVTRDQAFTLSPINYTIGSTPFSFGIPTYTIIKTGCTSFVDEYLMGCLRIDNALWLGPSSYVSISPSGGSIY